MMTIEEATELMQKDKQCATKADDCFVDGIRCSDCDLFVDPYALDEARWTALRIMEAWTKAKEDIRKECGCSTALDILERYENGEEGKV